MLATYRQPDLAWITTSLAILLEIDEGSHSKSNYSLDNEVSKVQDQTLWIKRNKPVNDDCLVITLRFDPGAKSDPAQMNDRVEAIAKRINALLGDPEAARAEHADKLHAPVVEYWFYQKGGRKHIEHMRAQGDSVTVKVVEEKAAAPILPFFK